MRTVLITGGSRGIGAVCVRKFARLGDKVYFFYRSNQEAAALLSAETGAVGIQWDVSQKGVEEVFATLPPIDVLVNNAGIAHFSLFQDLSEEDWDRMIQTHLGGTFRCSKAALPRMIAQKRGCIINISSMWGQVGASCEVAYSAAKAGIIGLTKALAKEVGPSGVRVNCVAPGVIATDMNAALTEDTLLELAEETPLGRIGTPEEVSNSVVWLETPLGRIGTPEEVSNSVVWLASDEASFITGQVLGINGGLVL